MDKDKIIDGLRMTMDLFTFDPTTGEEKDPDDLNDLDRATYDACKGALEILERLDTDSDTISRQAAIDICRAPHMRNADCSDFEMAIMMLPPAQPERIKGRWEVASTGYSGFMRCSVCKTGCCGDYRSMNFCPNCGADMREVTT